ncbi:MAG: hypothetical protein ACYTGS_15550, partial [Planctomycetota bacterium]
YVRAFGFNMVRLPQVVFAIDEVGASEIGPFDVPKPGMYENIGPVRDVAEQVMAIVRVTQAEKASEPNSVNEAVSKATLKLEPPNSEDSNRPQEPAEANDVYSVRKKVVEDLKRLAAMDTTKAKAEEFKVLVANEGWDEALDRFNQLYGEADPNRPEPNQTEPNEADPNALTEDPARTLENPEPRIGHVRRSASGQSRCQLSGFGSRERSHAPRDALLAGAARQQQS